MESLSEYFKHSKNQLSAIYLSAQIKKEVEKLTPEKIRVIVRHRTVVFECQNASQLTRLKKKTQDIENIFAKMGEKRGIRFRIARFTYQ